MKKLIVGAVVALLAVTGCGRYEPKEKDVKRIQEVCGPAVAHRYAEFTWVDRDYASDNLALTCILFPEETLTRDNVRREQVGG